MRRVILAASLAAFGTAFVGTAAQAADGYVTQPNGGPVTNPFGLCWRSGFWTPDRAAEPCDAVPRAAAPPPPPVVVAPPPAPAPAPEPAAAAPAPAPAPAPIVAAPPPIEKVSLSADVVFEFNKAELRDEGKRELDALVQRLQGAQVDEIVAVGHADRIGSDAYNQRLSERRAEAVKQHLQASGARQVVASGKGESEPVTGESCKGVRQRGKLVDCLQPDRRVEIEVYGTRNAAAGPGGAASGATIPGR